MSATILGFPIQSASEPVELSEDLRAAFDGPPSQACLDEIEAIERQNRKNAAAFMRRNPTIR